MLLQLLSSLLLTACLNVAAQTPLTVAAAGDLRGTLERVQEAFAKRHPEHRLRLSFGASGSLCTQIQQGAPFDLFLSADEGFPAQLMQAGFGSPEGPFPYATGALVLWVRRDLGLDPVREGLKLLLRPELRKVASADPRLAPYGRAGEAALKRAGVLEAVKPRLVLAENISQAAQFLQSGSAEAGLISRSQALKPILSSLGVFWTLPPEAHPPLKQAGLVLKGAQAKLAAAAFRSFLLGPEGQMILAQHGFGKP